MGSIVILLFFETTLPFSSIEYVASVFSFCTVVMHEMTAFPPVLNPEDGGVKDRVGFAKSSVKRDKIS